MTTHSRLNFHYNSYVFDFLYTLLLLLVLVDAVLSCIHLLFFCVCVFLFPERYGLRIVFFPY